MDAATLAMSAARCRIAIGIALVAVPSPAVRAIGADPKTDGMAPALGRMLGGRDIALGLGTVVALDHGGRRCEAGWKVPRWPTPSTASPA
jgi:hypothetical protein